MSTQSDDDRGQPNDGGQHVQIAASLDGRRARSLDQIAGNEGVKNRLRFQKRSGALANLQLFHGPTGVGKTTIAECLLWWHICENRNGRTDCCGHCGNCTKYLDDVGGHVECEVVTGDHFSRNWETWHERIHTVRRWEDHCIFIDEGQDLHESHQKGLLRLIEGTAALFIVATTHIDKINDAFINRFGTNVHELQRPSPKEAVVHLGRIADRLHVSVDAQGLSQVGARYSWNIRKCEDFIYSAAKEVPNRVVSVEYLRLVLGDDAVAECAAVEGDPSRAIDARRLRF